MKTELSRSLMGAMFVTALVASPLALAHGGGGGGMSGSHGDFGGNTLGHDSVSSAANTNGSHASDRDFGKSRAEDRHLLRHGRRHHGNGKSKEENRESATAELHEH